MGLYCLYCTFSTVWSSYILRKFSFYVVNSFSNNSLCQSRTASVMSWPVALLAFFQNWGENLKKNPRKIFPAKHKPTAKIFCTEKKFAGTFFPHNVKCQSSELKSCITKKRNGGWDCTVGTVL